MTALPDALAVKVSKIIGQFGSDNSHVVTTAAAMLQRTLSSNGCDLNDLAAHIAEGPREIVIYRERPTEPQQAPRDFDYASCRRTWTCRDPRAADRHRVTRCQQSKMLSTWEKAFLVSIAQHLAAARDLTPKQRATLDGIAAKVGANA